MVVVVTGGALVVVSITVVGFWSPPEPIDSTAPSSSITSPDNVTSPDMGTGNANRGTGPSGPERAVAELLGRPPQAAFEVVVRNQDGEPVVIRNEPLLEDGTPMPTRYWLVGREERRAVGRLESSGGVRAAEAAVEADALAAAHRRYAAERDATLALHHEGPRPSGGVGGTRRGVKCLHAHYAWYLAGGDDPVGRWVADRLARAPAQPPATGR